MTGTGMRASGTGSTALASWYMTHGTSIKDHWYYLVADGAMVTGQQTINMVSCTLWTMRAGY